MLGSLLGGLFGAGRNVVTETVEVFRPNAEAADRRAADAQAAALAQMAAEFGGQGWFNRLVEALMGAIVAFYFGAREMAKMRAGGIAKEAARIVAQAPQVVSNIRALEALRHDSPGAADTGRDAAASVEAVRPGRNPALEELLR
ncbi:MAG: carboxylesterase [Alphaproteobacteria bacterium HGW-Alphaproteobacteria-2]|nr:MAG: carboxylesterase [Alphaproteobacteria bacterium HGW-Alphaproteobacteria-2]